jgi:hypothetical protein
MWFETLTGFKEESPEQVRSKLEVSGSTIQSDPTPISSMSLERWVSRLFWPVDEYFCQ